MIVYFDTSAIVPILIAEPSTQTCRRAWVDADRRASSRLTSVEVAAALAMADRQGRIGPNQHEEASENFLEIWPDVDIVDVTAELAATAAHLARVLALRAYDAVHCASAALISDGELIAATGDARLLAAWGELGLATLDVHLSS